MTTMLQKQSLQDVLDTYQRLRAEHKRVVEEIQNLEYRRANRWAAVLDIRHVLQEALR